MTASAQRSTAPVSSLNRKVVSISRPPNFGTRRRGRRRCRTDRGWLAQKESHDRPTDGDTHQAQGKRGFSLAPPGRQAQQHGEQPHRHLSHCEQGAFVALGLHPRLSKILNRSHYCRASQRCQAQRVELDQFEPIGPVIPNSVPFRNPCDRLHQVPKPPRLYQILVRASLTRSVPVPLIV